MNLVYDFKINNIKIQEKTGFYISEEKYIQFNLTKTHKKIAYKEGDCDFFWLNCPNDKNFLIIPEKLLVDKTTFRINIVPIYSSIPWYRQYLFDYTNLDKNNIYKTLGV